MKLMKQDRQITKFKAIRINQPTPILSIVCGGLLINEVVSLEVVCDEAVPQVHVGQYCTIVHEGYVVSEDGTKHSIKNGIVLKEKVF